MHSNGIQFLADSLETQKISVRNVMATATVAGGVYALDLTAIDADTSGATDPVIAALANIVGVATANLGGVLVVTPKIIEAGEEGEAIVSGPCKVLIDGTADCAKGKRLKAVNATHALVVATDGTADIGVGIALEAVTANTPTLARAIFDGFCFNKALGSSLSDLGVATLIADPGDGQAIPVLTSGYVPLVTGAGQTRTIAAPTFPGQQLLLYVKTDGGTVVIAVASTVNQTGNNRITMAEVNDMIQLIGIENGASLVWRVVCNDGAALSTV